MGPKFKFAVTRWNTRDGLPQNTVNHILRSRQGELWLCTYGGAALFDGRDFTVYSTRTVPNLPSLRFLQAAETEDGSVWFRTESRTLVRRHNGNFTAYELPIPESYHLTNMVIYRGMLIIGTSEHGLWRFAGEGWTPWKPLISAFHLSVDPGGDLWIFQQERIMKLLRNGTLRVAGEGLDNRSYNVHWFARDSALVSAHSRLYLQTRNGLKPLPNGKTPERINAMTVYQGELLIGTTHAIYSYRPDKGCVRSPMNEILGEDGITSFLSDSFGNLWVGSSSDGLYKCAPKYTVTWGFGPENISESATGVLATSTGNLYAFFHCYGLARFTGKGWEQVRGTEGNCFLAGVELPDGDLLLTNYSGVLFRWTPGSNSLRKVDTSPLRLRRPGALLLKDNKLLIGHMQGVCTWDLNGEFTSWSSLGWPLNITVLTFFEDSRGRLWTGTNRGAGYWLKGSYHPVVQSGPLHELQVRAIMEDKDGDIWLGTYGHGLFLFRGDSVISLMEIDREFPEVISAFHQIDDLLWMTSNNGIWLTHLSSLKSAISTGGKSLECWRLGRSAGLHSTEFNGGTQNSVTIGPNGHLWFPGIKGVVEVDPFALYIPNDLPLPRFSEVVIDQKAQKITDELIFPPKADRLEVRFNLPYFGDRSNLEIRYRMKGLESNWHRAGNQTLSYSHLPPGNYVLELRVSNRFDRSQYRQVEQIIIAPASFYQHPIFYMMMAWGVALALILFWQYRINRIRTHNSKLKALVKKRTSNLQKTIEELQENQEELMRTNFVRSKVMSILTHNVKGPLKYLQHLASLINDRWDDLSPEELKESNQTILSTAEALNQMVLDILQWSRIQAQDLPLKKERYNLSERVDADMKMLAPLAKRKDVELINELPEDFPCWFDQRTLSLILQNLLSNSIKFTRRGGRVWVRAVHRNKKIILQVIDNGVGIRPEDRSKLFDPNIHISLPGTENEQGTGLGLLIVSDLLQKMQGDIVAKDYPEGGTVMEITLPD